MEGERGRKERGDDGSRGEGELMREEGAAWGSDDRREGVRNWMTSHGKMTITRPSSVTELLMEEQ